VSELLLLGRRKLPPPFFLCIPSCPPTFFRLSIGSSSYFLAISSLSSSFFVPPPSVGLGLPACLFLPPQRRKKRRQLPFFTPKVCCPLVLWGFGVGFFFLILSRRLFLESCERACFFLPRVSPFFPFLPGTISEPERIS